MFSKSPKIFVSLLFLLFIPYAYASIGIEESDWLFTDGASIIDFDNQKAILLTRGKLTNTNLDFHEGIIEFDIYTEGERSFVYVYFREQSSALSEVLYLRTHKSNSPDTLQYSPVIQRRSAWQLYHGKKGTAAANIPANTWVRVKLEVKGSLLTVWVGDNPAPVMHEILLTGKTTSGGISFRGNIPPVSDASYSAYIRNIQITPKTYEHERISEVAVDDEDTIPIQRVWMSPIFTADKSPIMALPEEARAEDWRLVHAQYDNVFELLRWREIPNGVRSWAAAMQFTLDSPMDQQCELMLGYSDAITLHVNGLPTAFANASYRYADNRQQGVLHADQMRVFVPLKAGKNTMQAIVADSFGGWGFQATMKGCDGVESHVEKRKR